MRPSATPRVKICCIASVEEMWMAVGRGAAALGFVSAMPSGPGPIAEDEIARIVGRVPPGVATFLLTSRQDAAGIIEQQRCLRVNTIQIVDRLIEGNHADLKRALPGVTVVQVVHVTGERSVEQAQEVAPRVDALLLDSGNPELPVKELGGTGRTHDWKISRRIREIAEVPVWLAGGLNAGNVAQAIEEVGPFGVDVCSGVRSGGALDDERLSDFMRAVESARPL